MIPFFSIFSNTKETLKKTQENPEAKIDTNNISMFMALGIAMWLPALFVEQPTQVENITFKIFSFIMIVGLSVVMGKFVINYIYLGISRLLKGNATKLQIETVIAFSLVPKILALPIVLILLQIDNYYSLALTKGPLFTIIDIIVLIFFIKIIFQGLHFFNGFGVSKTLITISPMIIILIVTNLMAII